MPKAGSRLNLIRVRSEMTSQKPLVDDFQGEDLQRRLLARQDGLSKGPRNPQIQLAVQKSPTAIEQACSSCLLSSAEQDKRKLTNCILGAAFLGSHINSPHYIRNQYRPHTISNREQYPMVLRKKAQFAESDMPS